MKNCILACVDNSINSIGICDAAIHFAKLLNADITLLHALEPSNDIIPDLSGGIHFEVHYELIEKLLDEEERQEKKAFKNGKELLKRYEHYCGRLGIATNSLHLKGDLAELVSEVEKDYKLLIVGKFGESESGIHTKELIKSVNIPVMIANKEFKPIEKVLFAYDGSENLNKALEKSLHHPLFINAERTLLHLGKDNLKSQEILLSGKKLFDKFNKEVKLDIINKTTPQDLLDYATKNNSDVIAMGAYSSSKLMHLFFGSFTNEIIKKSTLPLFIFK